MSQVDNLSISIHGPADTATQLGAGNWLIIEPESIPEQYQLATPSDLDAMMAQLSSGYSAYSFFDPCPVIYGTADKQRVATYTAKVLVHRSLDVEYEVEITKDGLVLDHDGLRQEIRSRSVSYDIDYNKTQQLGWRARQGTFAARWEIAFDKSANRISSAAQQPTIEHVDGFAYLLGDPVFGTFRATGLAEIETCTVKIQHQLGTKWNGGLQATAWWPAGAERKDQQSAIAEILLPECVLEKFNDCSREIADARKAGLIIPADPIEGGEFDRILIPVQNLYVDDCSGEIIGKRIIDPVG